MKVPNFEELRNHFKNAQTVKCLDDGDTYYLDFDQLLCTNVRSNGNSEIYLDNQIVIPFSGQPSECYLWKELEGFAKILTYKEKTFSITESQINRLNRTSDQGGTEITIPILLKEWFPEAFENEVKLEAGKYYKHPNYPKFLTCLREDKTRFGIDVYGNWFDDGDIIKDEHQKNYKEATQQEVFEALKNEAVKRGFGDKIFIKRDFGKFFSEQAEINSYESPYEKFRYFMHHGGFENYGVTIFKNGKWAEIIPTITKAEAEKKLNVKII